LHTRAAPQLVPAATVEPPQVPLVHTSLDVQALPSLQLVPLMTLDQAVVDVAGVQTWQALAALIAPLA
jgi:hypothetical protein